MIVAIAGKLVQRSRRSYSKPRSVRLLRSCSRWNMCQKYLSTKQNLTRLQIVRLLRDLPTSCSVSIAAVVMTREPDFRLRQTWILRFMIEVMFMVYFCSGNEYNWHLVALELNTSLHTILDSGHMCWSAISIFAVHYVNFVAAPGMTGLHATCLQVLVSRVIRSIAKVII